MIDEQHTGRYEQDAAALETEDISFPDEVKHLAEINQKLNSSLENANANVERMDREYMDAKRYMVENRGEIDPHEMFQNELQLKQIDHQGVFSVKYEINLQNYWILLTLPELISA